MSNPSANIQMYKYIEIVYTFYVLLFTGCHITFQSAVSLALSFQRDELNPLPPFPTRDENPSIQVVQCRRLVEISATYLNKSHH